MVLTAWDAVDYEEFCESAGTPIRSIFVRTPTPPNPKPTSPTLTRITAPRSDTTYRRRPPNRTPRIPRGPRALVRRFPTALARPVPRPAPSTEEHDVRELLRGVVGLLGVAGDYVSNISVGVWCGGAGVGGGADIVVVVATGSSWDSSAIRSLVSRARTVWRTCVLRRRVWLKVVVGCTFCLAFCHWAVSSLRRYCCCRVSVATLALVMQVRCRVVVVVAVVESLMVV